jgi:hypothetical protein
LYFSLAVGWPTGRADAKHISTFHETNSGEAKGKRNGAAFHPKEHAKETNMKITYQYHIVKDF